MVKRIGGFRRKSRSKLRRSPRDKGKLSISKYFREFEENSPVRFHANSSVQNGMYHPRFHGKTGTVLGKQGACYKVKMNDGGKFKTILVHPIHLVKP